jgi:small subunit ribosomal protein S1
MQDQQGENVQGSAEGRVINFCNPLTNFDFSDMEAPDYDKTIKIFSEGDIVKGKVVKVDKDEVLIDVGYKSEGVIPARELSIRYDVKPGDVVKVGDDIEALVLQKEDKDGRLILSKKRAQYERAWCALEECMLNNGTVNGEVIEVVKGGLILDVGLRGFLPASLVDVQRVKELHPFLGKELECKIIEMDRNRNNVVLSRRAFLEDSVSERRKLLLEKLQKGDRVKGKVSSIVSFGAFVNLGGIDGLVHISELSWCHVEKPSEVVSVGDEVEVEILDIDRERERISLSLKATQADPWEALAKTVSAGDIINGTITKLVPFGAFVQVAPGIEGLIHISELSDWHIELPEEVVRVGEEVQVKVIDIDVDRRRVSLSLRQTGEHRARRGEAREAKEEAAASCEETPVVTEVVSEVSSGEVEKVLEEEAEFAASLPEGVAEAVEEGVEEELEQVEAMQGEELSEALEEAEEAGEISSTGGESLEEIIQDMKKKKES